MTITESGLLQKKLFLFDLDGTVYLGDEPFPYAVDFVEKLRNSGRKVLFFTNNASRSTAVYYERLTRMGFSPREGEILTSGDVTASFLQRERAGKKVYLLGTPALCDAFRQAGIELSDGTDDTVDIVVSSFDTTLEYHKLERICTYIRRGAEFLSTHPDYNCPAPDGFLPDCGAINALITASTGKTPRYFGKPYPDTARAIAAFTGVDLCDMCVFGDRLYTDIALGRRSGILSVLVMSGETTAQMLENADAADTPDLVFPSLAQVRDLFFKP